MCASGYGGGVANTCHVCTSSLKTGMYFAFAVVSLFMIVLAALLAVYLVSGRAAERHLICCKLVRPNFTVTWVLSSA